MLVGIKGAANYRFLAEALKRVGEGYLNWGKWFVVNKKSSTN